jgi:hypothetical protein
MGEKQWKRVEKRHAGLYGAIVTRTGFPALTRIGSMHGIDFPDWIDDWIAGESKSGDDLIPQYLRDWTNQAIANEKTLRAYESGQRIPFVVMHANGDNYNDDLVIVRSDIFRAIVLPAIHALQKVLVMDWDTERLK